MSTEDIIEKLESERDSLKFRMKRLRESEQKLLEQLKAIKVDNERLRAVNTENIRKAERCAKMAKNCKYAIKSIGYDDELVKEILTTALAEWEKVKNG